MQLTKAVLLGTKHKQSVVLVDPITKEEYEIHVRPLGHAEAAEIQQLIVGGMRFKGDPSKLSKGDIALEGDLGEVTLAQAKAARKAVALALVSEEKWTEEEIAKNWPAAWVDEAAKVVYEISGIQNEKSVVRNFRRISGGTGVTATDPAGDTAGK